MGMHGAIYLSIASSVCPFAFACLVLLTAPIPAYRISRCVRQ